MFAHCIFVLLLCILRSEGGAGKNGHKAVRSDDTSPLQQTQEQQATALASLQAEFAAMKAELASVKSELAAFKSETAQNNAPLLFTARVGSAYGPHNDGDIIRFANVIASVGNMYDSVSGIVTVPQPGVYLIYLREDQPSNSENYLSLHIMVNGADTAAAVSEHGVLSGVTVAVKLQAGDRIWIKKTRGTVVEGITLLTVVRVSP